MLSPALRQRLLGGRHGPDAHHLGVDAGEGEADQPHRDRQAELGGDVLGGEQAGGGAVVEPGGVAGGDPAVRPERGPQAGQRLDGGAGARRLVGGGQAPALLGAAGGDRDQRLLDHPVRRRPAAPGPG